MKKTFLIIGGVLLAGTAAFLVYKTMKKRKEQKEPVSPASSSATTDTPPVNPGDRASFGEDLKDVTKEALADVRSAGKRTLDNLI